MRIKTIQYDAMGGINNPNDLLIDMKLRIYVKFWFFGRWHHVATLFYQQHRAHLLIPHETVYAKNLSGDGPTAVYRCKDLIDELRKKI